MKTEAFLYYESHELLRLEEPLDVEAEMHHIAILNQILFAF